MLLKEYLEAIDYRITGGSEYTWRCFGDNARYLDCIDDEGGSEGDFSINCIFDAVDQTVYVLEAWDYINNREYRWINPDYRSEHDDECAVRGIDPRESLDGRNFIDLEVSEDIIEKITAIAQGEEYDERVKVPVEFSDDELLRYMKIAHERDITFNQLVEEALRVAIDEHRRDPEAFQERTERWKREKGIL